MSVLYMSEGVTAIVSGFVIIICDFIYKTEWKKKLFMVFRKWASMDIWDFSRNIIVYVSNYFCYLRVWGGGAFASTKPRE